MKIILCFVIERMGAAFSHCALCCASAGFLHRLQWSSQAQFSRARLSDILYLDIQFALLDGFRQGADGVGDIFPLIDLKGCHARLQLQHLAAVPC